MEFTPCRLVGLGILTSGDELNNLSCLAVFCRLSSRIAMPREPSGAMVEPVKAGMDLSRRFGVLWGPPITSGQRDYPLKPSIKST
jgi:hypothetical protein